jgi:hypothetical protein
MNTYDYIIVGAGPSGLTCAQLLSKNNKVLLIEKETNLGGCHRVKRVNGLFTEHSPRVYMGNFFNVKMILNDMNIKWDDMFTKYKIGILIVLLVIMTKLKIREMYWFVIAYFKFLYNRKKMFQTTLEQYMLQHDFSEKAMDYINRLCILNEGATIKRYTVGQFIQLLNQNFFYNIYLLKKPSDMDLFKKWESQLRERGVDILTDTAVIKINENSVETQTIEQSPIPSVTTPSVTASYRGKKIIIALPPRPMVELVYNSDINLVDNKEELKQWSKKVGYINYVPVVYHWNKKFNLNRKWGFPRSEWGVMFFTSSDYMEFDDPRSKTVISIVAGITDVKSSYTGKTINESSKEEIIDEVFRQLRESFKNLPKYDHVICSAVRNEYGDEVRNEYADVVRNEYGDEVRNEYGDEDRNEYGDEDRNEYGDWRTEDDSFVRTVTGYKSSKTNYDNIFWVGTHNGNSDYNFTSMESAISNSLSLIHKLEPGFKKTFRKQNIITLTEFLATILIVISICYISKYVPISL